MCVSGTCTTQSVDEPVPPPLAGRQGYHLAQPPAARVRETRVAVGLLAGALISDLDEDPRFGARVALPFFYGPPSERLEFRLEIFDAFVVGAQGWGNLLGAEAHGDFFLAPWLGIEGRVGLTTSVQHIREISTFGLGASIGGGFFLPIGEKHGPRVTLGLIGTFVKRIAGGSERSQWGSAPDAFDTNQADTTLGILGNLGFEFAF